jgi:hypothetical protein
MSVALRSVTAYHYDALGFELLVGKIGSGSATCALIGDPFVGFPLERLVLFGSWPGTAQWTVE